MPRGLSIARRHGHLVFDAALDLPLRTHATAPRVRSHAIRSSSTTSSKAIRALGQRHRRCSTTSYSGAPGPKPKGISTLVPANCAVHPPPAQRRITVGRLTQPFGRWRASLRARADAGVLLLVFMTPSALGTRTSAYPSPVWALN